MDDKGVSDLRRLAKLSGYFNEDVWEGLSAEQVLGALQAADATAWDMHSLTPIRFKTGVYWYVMEEKKPVAVYRIRAKRKAAK